MNRLLSLAMVALALTLTACSGNSSGPPAGPSIDPDALKITAKDLQFSTSTLVAPADEAFQIAFENQESAPHNVAIYRDAAATEEVFVPEPFGGPAAATYEVPALEAGTYIFRCDIHPEMSGEITVS
jgi:plastocyanin